MNTRISATLGFTGLVAGLVVGCKSDPTNTGVGTPSAVVFSLKSSTLAPGDSVSFTAEVVDNRVTPLDAPITFTSCDPSVATVAVDPSFVAIPPTSERAIVRAVAAPATCIVGTSGPAKPDTLTVGVLPTAIAATFAASADAGTTLSIMSTAALKFDPATVSVAFGGGEVPPILSATADQIQVLVPFTPAGPLTISGIAVTYVPGLIVNLPTTASFTQTGTDPYPGDSSWATAPNITSLIPASGQTHVFLATEPASNPTKECPEDRFLFGPAGRCSIFEFTLADTAKISFTTDWDGGSTDSDFLICSDSTRASYDTTFTTFHPCENDGLAGASSAKPETAGGVKYPPGTWWFVAQDFAGQGVKNYYVTVKVQ